MIKLTWYILFSFSTLVTALLPAQEQVSQVFPETDWAEASPESQGLDSHKVAAAMAYIDAVCGEVGSSQTVLIRNGYKVWQGKDIDNKHLVWSCTKSFTGVSFSLLWDDGKINPETYMKDIDPAFAEYYPEVQIKHLGSFTSGMKVGREDWFTPKPALYPCGKHYNYSAELDILSYLCAKSSGQTLQSLFKQRVADPIGIPEASWTWGKLTHPDGMEVNGGSGYPGSGVEISARSMARFGWLLANKGKWKDQQLVSERFLDYATHPHWHYPEITAFDEKAWYTAITGCYGFCFWVNGVRPDGLRMWPHATENTFAVQGNKNNICIVVPEWRLVLVRLGGDKNINCDLYDAVLLTLRDGMTEAAKKE